ncbi:MAG: hypothetical protein F4Z23_11590 [Acidimicrobiaceae bacterium]|nr:hypothetical protein [Acidimicrobiaceae bacterium]
MTTLRRDWPPINPRSLVRVIDNNDLRAVTPGAKVKDRFMIVDAVGVTDAGLHDTVPLERNKGVSFDRLLNQIGLGSTEEAVVSSVVSRLARLNRRITAEDRAAVEKVAGIGLDDLVRQITDALDPDRQHTEAAAETGTDDPTPEQVKATAERMIAEAVQPIAGNAQLREKLIDIRRSYEQVMDTGSKDKVISGEYSKDAADRARAQTQSFRQFIEDHKDEITALQVLYSQPRGGGLAYTDIKELAQTIKQPPHRWTPEALWQAYETLDASKVRGSGHRVSTDLVSLVRHTLGHTNELVAYPDLVDERFEFWLHQQQTLGRHFTDDQTAYLHLIKEHIAASLTVAPADLQNPPFSTYGGLGRARQLFGNDLNPLLEELTLALAA